MKKNIFLLALLVAPLSMMQAQRVVTDNFSLLEVHYQTPTPEVSSVPFGDGKANLIQLAGYQPGGEVGSPTLPVSIELITIPFCSAVDVEVSNAVYDTLSLSNLYPLQPSRFKSDTLGHAPVVNAERYATDAFYGLPLAQVEVLGIARDRRLANLTFSPLQVNPVSGQVVVCRSADITVRYRGSDKETTREHFNRYYTPAFSAGSTLNQLFSAKDVSSNAPLRMVIVAPRSLNCGYLQRFANWKRSQGMIVDILVPELQGLSGNSDIADYLQGLYDNASAEAPAPSYLILVGDNAQVRAFNSQISDYNLNDHITDLYFVTWTSGDILPDCYQGRFSASDTVTLANIIKKTLLYEQYAFEDDSYLARAALIAGEDNGTHQTSGWSVDHAWMYCDPTMDYIAKTYINADNGYDTVSYYKNNVNYAPDGVTVTGYCSSSSSATELRNLYSSGLGWINYSAHGDWDKWHKPNFTVTHIGSMNNNNMPSVMIGNCCLTNKFDKPACFGETLLRRANNAGAVCYFGGTNSTLWTEDFYWSVGVRSSIYNDMNTNYSGTRLGMYDCLFHTHGEEVSKYAVTAGAMLMVGNMAVNTSSSTYKTYYWEIYELMGDPSLLPWLGRAANLQVSLRHNGEAVEITSAPYAYVALVDTVHHTLFASAFANANGKASFTLGDDVNLDNAVVAVTAQGYKPYFVDYNLLGVHSPLSALNSSLLYPNPATSQVTVEAANLQRVDVLDPAGRTLSSIPVYGSQQVINLQPYRPGIYFLRLHTSDGLTVKKLIIQ